MSLQDEIEAHYGPIGELVPDGKIHRFHAPDDEPGHDSGWYLRYPSGEGCAGSLHGACACHADADEK